MIRHGRLRRNPFHRHLYWQIHVAFVFIALCSVGIAMLASRVFAPPEVAPRPLAPIAEYLAETLDPADPGASVGKLGERLQLRLELWSPEFAPLGRSEDEMQTPDPRGPSVQWLPFQQGPAVAVHLRDGRWLGMGYHWEWDHRRFVFGLLVLAAAVSLLVYPLARRITRRLERLRRAVDAWGHGDLSARARVHGYDEVAELAAGFNVAADKVQALLDSQRRMLASASHELRSPLARVRMAVELLDDGSPERAKVVDSVNRDVEELDALVADLLLASRLQGQPAPGPRESVDMLALVREEGDRAAVAATGVEVRVFGDGRMLRRAVRNLLENARRHAGLGGAEMELRREESTAEGEAARTEAHELAVLEVRDRGPGVPPGDAERIFEPFYRAAGHAEGRDGGVGLGLALVRDIARHHGGECAYLPREGGGSIFRLSLPAERGG